MTEEETLRKTIKKISTTWAARLLGIGRESEREAQLIGVPSEVAGMVRWAIDRRYQLGNCRACGEIAPLKFKKDPPPHRSGTYVCAWGCEAQEKIPDVLHPDGRCTCGGEGHCVWCLTHCNDCGSTLVAVFHGRLCPHCDSAKIGVYLGAPRD